MKETYLMILVHKSNFDRLEKALATISYEVSERKELDDNKILCYVDNFTRLQDIISVSGFVEGATGAETLIEDWSASDMAQLTLNKFEALKCSDRELRRIKREARYWKSAYKLGQMWKESK